MKRAFDSQEILLTQFIPCKIYVFVSLLLALFCSTSIAFAQNSNNSIDSINRLTNLDYQEMKSKLGIGETRPGPSGDPKNANAANTDESKVTPYTLPDLLLDKTGKTISIPAEWWDTRRPELAEDLENEMYGRLPYNLPVVNWTVTEVREVKVGPYTVREKVLSGIVDNSSHPEIEVRMEMIVGTPMHELNPVPLVLEFGFIRSPFGGDEPASENYFVAHYEPRWKQQLISQGWGYAILVPNSIQADHGAGLKSGIIGLANKGQSRTPEQWGVLRAWAWGASKAIDYFEKDKDVDPARIAIEGTSRYGKAALVAMAFEPRISLGFIGSSGAGGAALLRRNFGEQVENLASSGQYHWFSGNFIKYASLLQANDLPIDAHSLIALCAPRGVFISAGSPQIEGQWIDAKGMFLAGVHASPAYELLGKKGLNETQFPFIGTAMSDGEIAFRQHAGGHTTGPNWSTWIAWASKYWDNKK